MTQWHPLFAQLLRPLLESHYEVQTNVAVGDAPRQADVLLLKRTSSAAPPFHGLWQRLTTWNVLEFKGPTVSARVDDLDALVELGLGIHRRLNAERAKARQPQVDRDEVSFWYLANHLGRRFLNAAQALAGPLEETAAGIWRAAVWQRPLVLVSSRAVAVERDSLPIHLLSAESAAVEQEVVRLLGAHPELWRSYSSWLGGLHPAVVEEILHMKRGKAAGPIIDVRPLFKHLGWQEILQQTGVDELAAQLTTADLKALVAQLTAEQRQVIVRQTDVNELAALLTAEQRQELLRRLQEPPPPGGRDRRKKS